MNQKSSFRKTLQSVSRVLTANTREEQAAIEIEVGAVRIRVRGTVDRRALCEVLAAVGTVGR
ncbi:hypothetical protein QA639_33340 [Bradyrhizobium pachyrhizi]|uniref:hypothetical protein n=1 Tax=Bradyrhizobium pachyrhizi TaxID=280333 RepID=UPI000A58E721|nr:hypothetical protein [Bradyrhizobium pachyrhizi]WFU54480.1 hypothetical protein QA639_33340 [Bradyrhizobium pachyrhizi]